MTDVGLLPARGTWQLLTFARFAYEVPASIQVGQSNCSNQLFLEIKKRKLLNRPSCELEASLLKML